MIKIDLKQLYKSGLPVDIYILFLLIYNKDYVEAEKFFKYEELDDASVIYYEKRDYVKFIRQDGVKGIYPKEKLVKLFGKKTPEERANGLIEEYRELFPIGQKGDKHGCLKKMTWFIKNYGKEYTNEEILDATEKYIETLQFEGRERYMRQAHYFIEKEGVSNLLGELEGMNTNEEKNENSLNEMK